MMPYKQIYYPLTMYVNESYLLVWHTKKNAIATAIGIHTNIYVTGPERGQKEHKLICSYIYVVVLVQSI